MLIKQKVHERDYEFKLTISGILQVEQECNTDFLTIFESFTSQRPKMIYIVSILKHALAGAGYPQKDIDIFYNNNLNQHPVSGLIEVAFSVVTAAWFGPTASPKKKRTATKQPEKQTGS